jgi:serine phosphatase RsbU (regulator of sigma subunit)
LLLFTDGIPDSMSTQNAAFGNKGVHRALLAGGSAGARVLGERLIKAVQQHAAGRAAAHDDVTLLCFGRTA